MYPVAGSQYLNSDYHLIDLSINNQDISNALSQDEIMNYILDETRRAGKKLAYGGYRERRDFYLQSELFQKNRRTVHLGIDVWLAAQEPVYMHADGVIHSIQYNDAHLDYGHTIITKHTDSNQLSYALYGHLSAEGLSDICIGDRIEAGSQLAAVGSIDENGGWAPHLHFQLIHNLEDFIGDYPGVCSESDSAHYFINCPNPIKYILP